jgi:hypothetical protein
MIWDCWWLNLCSENAGVGVHFIFGGCWICKPHNMKVLYPNQLTLGQWVGCGGNCFYCGSMCCTPTWLL